ncbi:hypothetical protein ACH5RR_015836 [Cinchona calisaya]|uniref:Uncharacterized protein n=1 Tax=Cinchona calisaya TaxID=153742 RepID=A0ABD2ZU94_9GENT
MNYDIQIIKHCSHLQRCDIPNNPLQIQIMEEIQMPSLYAHGLSLETHMHIETSNIKIIAIQKFQDPSHWIKNEGRRCNLAFHSTRCDRLHSNDSVTAQTSKIDKEYDK